MAHAGGRPRLFTPELLQEKVNAYFKYCEENDKKANKQGLTVFLDINPDTLIEWENEKDKYPEFSETIKKAAARMSDLFQQRVDPMAIISMKQQAYGGFIDRPGMEQHDVEIRVKLDAKGADPMG